MYANWYSTEEPSSTLFLPGRNLSWIKNTNGKSAGTGQGQNHTVSMNYNFWRERKVDGRYSLYILYMLPPLSFLWFKRWRVNVCACAHLASCRGLTTHNWMACDRWLIHDVLWKSYQARFMDDRSQVIMTTFQHNCTLVTGSNSVHYTWPYLQNESQWYLFWFWDIYMTAESTKWSLKWCTNYRNRFTGLVIITVGIHNTTAFSFWEISKVFIIQSLATSWHTFKRYFNDRCKHFLCIRSIISVAKRTGQYNSAKTPKSKQWNKPQWESGPVSIQLLSKGKVTYNCLHCLHARYCRWCRHSAVSEQSFWWTCV